MALAFITSVLSQSNPLVASQSGYGAADRLLDAPTNEAWIDPWVAHLRSLGVEVVEGYAATQLHVGAGRIAGATLTGGLGEQVVVRADHYVAAMPVEKARVLFDAPRSEEHTSELQSLMRISYAVFCLQQTKT